MDFVGPLRLMCHDKSSLGRWSVQADTLYRKVSDYEKAWIRVQHTCDHTESPILKVKSLPLSLG